MQLLAQLADAGVDEIACLVDFGVDADTVLDQLDALDALRERAAAAASDDAVAPGEAAPDAPPRLAS